jgi:hypothetical protein
MGPPKQGKSAIALDLALHVAQGRDYLGQAIDGGPGRVLYLDIDNPDSEIAERMAHLTEAGVSVAGDLYYLHPTAMQGIKPLDIREARCRDQLRQTVAEWKPDLVIVDVLREAHLADENDSQEMRGVCDALYKIVEGRALIIVHHTRKIPDDVTDPDPNLYGRGSSYLMGRTDANWILHGGKLKIVPRFDAPQKFKVEWNDDTNLFRFPELDGKLRAMSQVLSLCLEYPDRPHAQLASLAKERWGISRATYYRYLSGRACAHMSGPNPTL